MTTKEIVDKLWNLCNVLRDDGITYHQYVTELTFILFLKMASEMSLDKDLPEAYRWEQFSKLEGTDLLDTYRQLLLDLGKSEDEIIQQIFTNAQTNIRQPANLSRIVTYIDNLDWFDAQEEGFGELYEGLLEKNATEKKSGAGQYFTPRPLIDVMVRLMAPQPGEYCNDPACGTFGFMTSVDKYFARQYGDSPYFKPEFNKEFQEQKALTGIELVPDTHRLALMNARLHGLNSRIISADTLSSQGASFSRSLAGPKGGFDLVLANPPFGTKRGGERPTRDDFSISTSNKQLNFLMHIYRSLHTQGGARAAVVLPDNVLFEGGDGQKVRQDLMHKCKLHTILRLPTGIFYAQGVKTNVLFFERGTDDLDQTDQVWFYDMRSELPNFNKGNPLMEKHFGEFVKAYTGGVSLEAIDKGPKGKAFDGSIDPKTREKFLEKDPRWSVLSRAEIGAAQDSLDLGLMRAKGKEEGGELASPSEILGELKKSMNEIVKQLKALEKELG